MRGGALAAVAAIVVVGVFAQTVRADEPTETPTDTPTETPVGSPTPTPTPLPEGCYLLVIDADQVVQAIATDDESFPPPFESCTDESAAVGAHWIDDPEAFERRTLLLTWRDWGNAPLELSSPEAFDAIPDLIITQAWLRLSPLETWSADNLSLAGDWRVWGWECEETDDSDTNAADALSSAGACGAACSLSGVTANTPINLPLDDAADHIHRGGETSLRVQVAGTPSTGRNGLVVADGSDEEIPPPQLVVLGCLPSPTPTPEAGCHIDTFVPDENGWTITGSDSDPEDIQCTDTLAFRSAGHVYISLAPFPPIQGGSNVLVRWDTSGLPEDAIVSAATLRTVVYASTDSESASLAAD